jgi:hypothetical protein
MLSNNQGQRITSIRSATAESGRPLILAVTKSSVVAFNPGADVYLEKRYDRAFDYVLWLFVTTVAFWLWVYNQCRADRATRRYTETWRLTATRKWVRWFWLFSPAFTYFPAFVLFAILSLALGRALGELFFVVWVVTTVALWTLVWWNNRPNHSAVNTLSQETPGRRAEQTANPPGAMAAAEVPKSGPDYRVARHCSVCGAGIDEASRYCHSCGTAVPGSARSMEVHATVAVAHRRSRWLYVWISLVLVVLIVGGSAVTTTIYLEGTYPGGASQWYSDVGGPAQLSELEVQNVIHRALVTVLATTWHSDTVSEGSGFFLGDTSTLVTAAHVLPSPVVELTVIDGAGGKRSAELMGIDKAADVAMLRVTGMSPLPLQAATHPLPRKSRVYMAGNPGGTAPGTVVKGTVVNTNFHVQVADRTVDHGYQLEGGPIGPGMSGGPLVDAWGKVLGVLSAGTESGVKSVAVPIREFIDHESSWRSDSPMYVGPPLIRTPAGQLVLAPSYMGSRNATVKFANPVAAEVTYEMGSVATRDLDTGVLWVEAFSDIKEARGKLDQRKSKVLADFPGASTQQFSIGDGGVRFDFQRSSPGFPTFRLMEVIWTERNVLVDWWIETVGWDESKLFAAVAEEQQRRLKDA